MTTPELDELVRTPVLRDRVFATGVILGLVGEVWAAWEHKIGRMILAPMTPFILGFWRRDLFRARATARRLTLRLHR